jgi:5-aminolevulinate synthase
MPCPFLTRLSANYVRNYAPILLKTYGNQCPVVTRAISQIGGVGGSSAGSSTSQSPAESPVKKLEVKRNISSLQQPKEVTGEDKKCPFLTTAGAQVKEVNQDIQDIPPNRSETPFAYEDFFHEQIMRKKKDHSYRVFKKVNRLAGTGQFPTAKEYSWGEVSELALTGWEISFSLGFMKING